VLHVQIGMKDGITHAELAPAAGGRAIPSVMVDVGKLASLPRDSNHTLDYRVGYSIILLDTRIERQGGTPHLSSTWTTTATPPEEYTVFVHVLDANGNLIGQADGPPSGGDYPTDWWSPGETIMDERPLPLPPEADRVTIGLYRLSDGMRLPVVDGAGQRVPDDEIVLPLKP
jgi:hypothetical protein